MLGPVAMMDIPVDNRDPVNAREHVCSGDCGIVEKAEPHCPVMFGMVTRRADKGECVLTVKRPLGRKDGGTRRTQGRIIRTPNHVGI
jgi:hypothetical protein